MPAYPWENEPDAVDFVLHGLPCAIRRGPGGHLCGYVGVPKGHALHGVQYDEELPNGTSLMLLVRVHGGLTYSAATVPLESKDGHWWFGFDCAHLGDKVPHFGDTRGGTYRTVQYVAQECDKLASQLAAMGKRTIMSRLKSAFRLRRNESTSRARRRH